MHARITRRTVQRAELEARQRLTLERIVPRARELPGIVAGYWLIDAGAGEAVSLTLWESELAMRASESAVESARKALENQGVLPAWLWPDTVEHYEVIAHFEASAGQGTLEEIPD